MQKKILCVMAAAVILLAGCAQGGGDRGAQALAAEIRAELTEMTSLTGRAAVTADYGERVYQFVLDLAYNAESGGSLTVVEPELIAGVKVRISPDGAVLEYDGASLETGPLLGTATSPIEAMPLLLSWARTGYISECAFETVDEIETLRMVCTEPSVDAGSGTQMTFWFDKATHTPMRAEVLADGYLVIACTFSGLEIG